MRRITIFFLAVFLALSFAGRAQVPSTSPNNGVVPAVFNTAGGNYTNITTYFGNYEWSFGELVLVQAFAPPDSSILLTHGVLQPCTDKIGYSPFITSFESGDYRLFPNPTSGKFEVNFFITTPGMMKLRLLNSVGQTISTMSYHYDGCCRIDLFDLTKHPAGIYFIMADFKPDIPRPGDNIEVLRRGGFKVIKLNN